MAENQNPPAAETSTGELRGQLVKRLAVAGSLVALLLGVLALFDRLATTSDEPESPVFTQPVPVAPKKEVTQPVTAASNLPEPPVPAAVEAPPPPTVETPATAVEPAENTKATSKSDSRGPARSTATTVKAPVVPVNESGPRQSTLPSSPVTSSVPEATAEPIAASPAASAAASKPAPTPPSARISEVRSGAANSSQAGQAQRLFSGFLLQAGVFSSAQRAEELHARLTLSGVSSTLETRVQVGPFRTRQEAEAAQLKLKQLGVESLLVPPKGAKN